MFKFISSIKSIAAYLVVLLPTLFALPAFAGTASLAWNASASTTVTGYKVHYGTASGVYANHLDAGKVLSLTVPSLTAGTKYYFAVTAYNSAGESGYSNEASATIPVGTTAPVASFTSTPTTLTGAAPLNATFTSTSTGTISTYAWNFGDGSSATTANASHNYSTPGTYTVSLKVTGSGGSSTTSKTVTASAAPVATADFSAPTTSGTAPLTVNFTATASSGLTTLKWNFGDGTTGSGSSASHTYTASGNYTVTLTASGTAGSTTVSKTGYIQVGNQLTAGFSANKVYGTAPLRVGFKDESSGTINSYSWSFGDGTTSTEANPVHIYRKMGDFTVSLTVKGPAGTKTMKRTAYVHANVANDLVVDFGSGNGIWSYIQDVAWNQIDSRNARNIVLADVNHDGNDEAVIDLGKNSAGVSLGIWVVSKDKKWTALEPRTASKIVVGDVDGNGQDDLLFDFGSGSGDGLWLFSNGSDWNQIDTRTAKNLILADLDHDGKDEIVADFGSGIWSFDDTGRWTQIDTRTATWMLAADMDGNGQTDLVADFGTGTYAWGSKIGVWVRFNGQTWFQIDPAGTAMAKAFSADDGKRDSIAIYRPATGSTWIYTHSTPVGTNLTDYVATDWVKVSAKPVTHLGAADLNADKKQDLVIDFGAGTSNGLWAYQKGVLKQINTKTSSSIASGQYNYGQ